MNAKFTDDDDLIRERQKLCARGNMIIRGFHFCSLEIKLFLFKTYMYSLYCCSLWAKFNAENMRRLKVCYNTVMRRLTGYPPWHSARDLFVSYNVRSFQEQLRVASYGFLTRVDNAPNYNLWLLSYSDPRSKSRIRARWNDILSI